MKIINLGILAHVDAGKTTLTESLLYTSGAIAELGSVDEGTTRTDTMNLERQRGITIQTAVTSFQWEDVKVNIIDTPGHMDFLAEVYRSLSVLDGAVLLVSAKDGIQAQTRILFHALQIMKIPTIFFINKIDQEGIDLPMVYREMKAKSYVQDIALAVLDCKETATSRETFIRLMNERGYGVDWQDSHKYITYTDLAREQAGEKACKIRDNKLEKYYNMDFGKESMEHEFERNARTAEAEQSKRAASRVKPTEPDRAGKQSAQRSVGDVERELRGIDEAVKSRTSEGRAEQAERRRAEQEAHQRAEAERRAAEEQQRIASRRYIGRDWEPER